MSNAGRNGATVNEDEGWRALFRELDPGGSGSVDVHALDTVLQAHESALILAESKTYQQKRDEGGAVNAEEFRAVMDELRLAVFVRFFSSLEVALLFAQSSHKRMAESTVSDALDPLSAIARGPESARLEFASLMMQDVTAMLEERIADRLVSEEVYTGEQSNADQHKFGEMQLGPRAIFDKGLETILGAPDLDVMKAMEKEHTEGEASGEEFEAYNNGKLRKVTPRQEWEKVLPQGTSGPINNCTYEGTWMCDDMMLAAIVVLAKLTKYEVVAIRLYSGPMFKHFNGSLRFIVERLEKHTKEAREAKGPNLTPEEEEEAIEAGITAVIKERSCRYVNTIHAINSALIKIARVTPIPPSGCGYRGLAGLKVPDRFLKADRFGCRAGVEPGFLSTSGDKEEAMGYINHDNGMPQLYVVEFGAIDRGADISDISYFPLEKEEMRLSINVNLKGRTIEELQAIRKNLHTRIADNSLTEVSAFVAKHLAPGAAELESSPEQKLGDTIKRQCAEVVDTYRKSDEKAFHDDNFYSAAIQDVLLLLSWATFLKDLHSNLSSLADELSSLSIKGRTPLHRACEEGHVATAAVLVDNGANVNAKNSHRNTPLFWAIENKFPAIEALLRAKGAV